MYYAYILRCADDSFYVGSAQDLDSRVKAHNDGRGAAHTFKHRPVQLVYSEGFESEIAAVTRERQLTVSAGVTEKSRHWWREIFDG